MQDLTISIVTYHGLKDVENLVYSIEKYTTRDITKTIYIIDNANEPEKYKQIVSRYSDVEYVNTKNNLGFGKGHNFIIDKLDSHYHAIINPDVILIEDTYEKLIEFMSDNNIGMCVPRITSENDEIQMIYRLYPTIFDMFIRMFCPRVFPRRMAYNTMQEKDYSKSFIVPFAQGSFLLIRTALWKEIGGFDDRYFMYMEDVDLCRRVNEKSKLVYCPYTTVIHKWEKGSHKNFKLLKIHIISMVKYFAKWGITWS